MDEMTSGTFKGNTLAQLIEWVWGQECGWGPIIGLGHTNEGTAATFRYSATEPKTKAEIRPVLDGQDLTVAGKSQVCEGYVFVLGQITKVAVFR